MALIGGFIAYQLRLPRVIGMLCAGLLMRNIPWSAVDAFPPRWGTQMRAAALGTIFLRCGLELDINTMKRYKMPAIRLALIPGLVEAFYDGGIATAPGLFGMPVLLGFSMGFILKAVGPGLVVPAMFKLQKLGYGRDQAMLLMFFLEYYGMLSGGALGALMVGLATSNFWERGFPHFASLGPSFNYSPEVERVLAIIWSWVMEPMLFVTIGSSIYFKTLPSGTIPKALAIIFSGLAIRMIMTFLVMSGFGYNTKEKLFYAFAWTPKATVQAALSATPLAMIQSVKQGEPDYAQWEQWGYDILTTGIFTIIICATLGLLLIHFTSTRFLELVRTLLASESDAHEVPHETTAAATAVQRVDSRRHQPVDAKHAASPSGAYAHEYQDMGVTLEDYEVVALYLDAISELSNLVCSGSADRDELKRLSDYVMVMKARVEQEVGQREVTVRELFRSASLLAANRPVVFRRTNSLPSSKGGAPDDEKSAV
ncbi:hypothetical protein QBZ16_005482 [Prototheca wickerhamii]|uniref:Cation/H+ exchanger transmembrane domain-containing protein n=1 Tax=Prototheca wickerhamii TaxID=3111 RepID=A0AAD9IID0_PROWI|nr:hypothetical protein QBZ16_005482 [Prototheca wickerhamii]